MDGRLPVFSALPQCVPSPRMREHDASVDRDRTVALGALSLREGTEMTKECPVCESMNTEDSDTCKHCGTAFFFEPESLQPPLDDPADELVVVGRYATADRKSTRLNSSH